MIISKENMLCKLNFKNDKFPFSTGFLTKRIMPSNLQTHCTSADEKGQRRVSIQNS